MTPKEKAQELAEKMHNVDFHDSHDEIAMQFKHAIKCALIAVEEILSFIEDEREGFSWKKYYQQVKNELEKL